MQNLWRDFSIGGLSASVSKIVAAPMETTKLVQQLGWCHELKLANSGISEEQKFWEWNTFSIMWFILVNFGFFAFFRGLLLPILRYFPTQALNFAISDSIRRTVPDFGPSLKFLRNIVTGGLAGAISLLLVYPFDTIHTLLASDPAGLSYTGIWDAASKVGLFGLYQGYVISVVGIVLYRAAYFGIYDSLRPHFQHGNIVARFFFGWAVTILAGLLTYPADTIRRVQMVTGLGPFDAFSFILDHVGYSGLFAGALANVFRALVGAGVLVLFDFVANMIYPRPPAHHAPPPPPKADDPPHPQTSLS